MLPSRPTFTLKRVRLIRTKDESPSDNFTWTTRVKNSRTVAFGFNETSFEAKISRDHNHEIN